MGTRFFSRLDTALRPFITRSLRGPRLRRTVVAAALLACFAALTGLWLAWGEGELERETRVALDLEPPRWEIEQRDLTRLAFGDRRAAELERSRAELARALERGERMTENDLYALDTSVLATAELTYATGTPEELLTPNDRDLQRQVTALLERHAKVFPNVTYSRDGALVDGSLWQDPNQRERLARLVQQQGLYTVRRYHSPLGPAGAARMVGLVAGGFLFLIVFVAGPAAAAATMAHESHERTIVPLTGTSLSARALALGLTAGSVTRATLLGAALIPLILVGALAPGGHLVPTLGLLVVLGAGGALAVGLAALLGLAAGAQRPPALVTAGLFVPLSFGAAVGWAIGVDLHRSVVGVVALLPQAAAAHLLRESFFPAMRVPASHAPLTDAGIAAVTVTALVLGALSLRALARWIAARSTPLLRRAEALVGVAVLTISADLAVLWPTRIDPAVFDPGSEVVVRGIHAASALGAFALIAGPCLLLLMTRVPRREHPQGGAPLSARTLATDALLLLAAPLLALLLAAAPAWPSASSVALAVPHLLWALAVGALIAIHLVARPPRWWAIIALGATAVLVCVEYVFATVTLTEYASRPLATTPFLIWGELSPGLGLIQAAYLVLVPAALLWRLRTARARPT